MTTPRYQISDSNGNQVIDAGIGYDDALRTAQSHADRTGHDWYLYEQGAGEADYMTVFPSAESIHITIAADGTSHDDVERVRLVIGSRPTESIGSATQLVELIDRAVSSGRLPEDDRDEAYRACCEHLGVDA